MRKPWTDDELSLLRERYDGKRDTVNRLAQQLGRTPNAIRKMAAAHGRTKVSLNTKRGKPWSEREDALLEAMLGQHPLPAVARRLRRSLAAVYARIRRLGLTGQQRDWYCLNDVVGILGTNEEAVRGWIERNLLRASREGDSPWHIAPHDLREFIRAYPHVLAGRRLDVAQVVQVIDLLAGVSTPNVD